MTELQETAARNGEADTEALRQRLDALKARKGRLSREIGAARKAGAATEEMVAELKSVSREYKTLSKALKASLNRPVPGEETRASVWDSLNRFAPPDASRTTVSVRQSSPDPADAARWDRFVLAHPLASAYHLSGMRAALESVAGTASNYLAAMDEGGEILGVLPLVQLKSRLFGNFVVSVPYFNYGGILANNADTARQLAEAAAEWADGLGAEHVEMRHLQATGLKLPKREEKVSFWLPLPGDEQTLWDSFKPKVRAQIRRPQAESPQIAFGGAPLLDDFYQVFARNMRDLGTPVYGKGFFRAMLTAFGDAARLVVVRLKGRPVGCAFLVGFRNRLEIPWASTLRETNPLGINMFMYWEIQRFAIAQGYEVFDFGRCTADSGTYRFKQQWGAQPIPLVWEYRLPEGRQLPQLNPDNPKFRLLIALWQRMPVWLTRILGPGIVRNLP